MIYEALGSKTSMGISVATNHGHCQFPAGQNAELTQFIDYFLLGGGSAPDDLDKSAVSADVGSYIDWEAPTLS